MRHAPLSFTVVCLVAGCRSAIDCGAYVYDEARQLCVCPVGTVEAPGGGCVAADAGVVDGGPDEAEGGVDGGACAPVTETCNGLDDDCDGRADETLLRVGREIAFAPAPYRRPHIVSLPTGFGVVYTGVIAPPTFTWSTASSSGTPSSAPVDLGDDLTSSNAFGFTARFDGRNVIIAYLDLASSRHALAAFAPDTGVRAWGPFTLPPSTGQEAEGFVRIADATFGHATVYAQFRDITTGEHSLQRFRLNTGGTMPVVTDQSSATNELADVFAWTVVTTLAAEVVLFRSVVGDIMCVTGATGDATEGFGAPFVVRTATQEPDVVTLAAAVRMPYQAVSANNPLGVAWHRMAGAGSAFVQLIDLSPSGVGTRAGLPGAQGSDHYTPFTLEVVAGPRSAGAHWLVVGLDDDALTTSGDTLIRAWEVIGDAATTQTLAVPGEVSASRAEMTVAVSGSAIAIAQEHDSDEIVLRLLGCP